MQACTRVWTRVFIQFSNRPLLTSLPPGTLVVMFSRTHSQLAASSRRDPDRIQPLASDVDRLPPPDSYFPRRSCRGRYHPPGPLPEPGHPSTLGRRAQCMLRSSLQRCCPPPVNRLAVGYSLLEIVFGHAEDMSGTCFAKRGQARVG